MYLRLLYVCNKAGATYAISLGQCRAAPPKEWRESATSSLPSIEDLTRDNSSRNVEMSKAPQVITTIKVSHSRAESWIC